MSMSRGSTSFLENRVMRSFLILVLIVASWGCSQAEAVAAEPEWITIPDEVLKDKIRGGLLGQILGNLNGLPHEFKYINEPGNVTDYVPGLPEGAFTDDDTDLEWVYIVEMQRARKAMLPPSQIAAMWKERINRRIWCANLYARQLMRLDLEPPLTGDVLLNPWAEFNISGQFLCETFALLAPAMPRTAARIALNYTTVAINQEPAQTTQLFTTMIARAFTENDIDRLIDAGLEAIDPNSVLRSIVADVRAWHAEFPGDWRATRQRVMEKYADGNTGMRSSNGYELNTASTIAALLYGRGDFALTLQTAFNFGWDCDNNAATSGTIVGVTKGYRWMLSQGWRIVDRYRNTSREMMPDDETITSFADRLIDLAELVITEQGGRHDRSGQPVYVIPAESPGCLLPLSDPKQRSESLVQSLGTKIQDGIHHEADPRTRARSAYLAICLDQAEELARRHPTEWARAVEALNDHWQIGQVLYFHSNVPAGVPLRERATAAGFVKPAVQRPLE
jgi:ADP-ribosylglycohydrolase